MISKRLQSVQPSLTLAVSQQKRELLQQGYDIVGFGAGEPDFDAPEHVKEAVILAMEEPSSSKYTSATGMPSLKRAIIANLRAKFGLTYETSQVAVTCGAKHALYNLFQVLCEEGDEVLIVSPYWVSYPEMVRLAGAEPVFVESKAEDGFLPRLEALKAAITPRTKVLLINSPSNPTGALWPKELLEGVADLLKAHEGIYVLSDEIYDELVYDGQQSLSLLQVVPELQDRTFVINGVSKAYAMTGWRIGWAAGPEEEMKALSTLQSHSTSNPTTIAQKAALAALTGSQLCVKDMRDAFEERRNLMCDLLDEIPNIRYVKPAGAFYVFCDFSAYYGKREGVNDSLSLAEYLLKEGHVATVPGVAFGDDKCQRLSFATSSEEIKGGLTRLKRALEQLG